MYFDAFGTKGNIAYVLMIDVERPKIEIGLQFFQTWYNGLQINSHNCLPYLFLPMHKKTYTDVERVKIITDHEHHLGTDSVVAIKGLHPLDTLVKLVNGVHTTIRRLLLSVPAANTMTGKLFVQIERQPVPNWMLCCFHSRDATKVTLKLATLEDTLKKAVPQECWNNLFLDDEGLKFSGQVAPLAKKKTRFSQVEVSPQTAAYVKQSFLNLFTPTMNRSADDMEVDKTQQSIPSTPKQAPALYATVVTPAVPHSAAQQLNLGTIVTVASGTATAQSAAAPSKATEIQELQQATNNHSKSLMDLRAICDSLVASQPLMNGNMLEINESFNHKFNIVATKMDDMSNTLDNLKNSPSRSGAKVHKSCLKSTDVILHG
jgi:hypothetical protein